MASQLENQFVEAQSALPEQSFNGASDAVSGLRKRGIESFLKTGFPVPREEAWKYTPVRKWLGDPFVFAIDPTSPDKPSFPVADRLGEDVYTACCVNGLLRTDLSRLPSKETGVTVTSLYEAIAADPDRTIALLERYNPDTGDPFLSLNQAFSDRGVFIHLARGARLDKPLVINDRIESAGTVFLQSRLLLVAEEDSAGTVVEIRDKATGSVADNTSFENLVSQVFLDKGADIGHVSIFDRGDRARQVRTLNVYQGAASRFTTHEFTFSPDLSRSNLNFLPDSEDCETNLNGFYFADGKAHIDTHTFVDHAKPRCLSNELFKGILSGNATAVFNGRVLVRQDAQQINAYQSNRNVLISDDARIYSKPELEIYADDVKCSHGATTGRLDDEALFYLQSRGIRKNIARRMLLEAFAADVVKGVPDGSLRTYVDERIGEMLRSTLPGA